MDEKPAHFCSTALLTDNSDFPSILNNLMQNLVGTDSIGLFKSESTSLPYKISLTKESNSLVVVLGLVPTNAPISALCWNNAFRASFYGGLQVSTYIFVLIPVLLLGNCHT